MCEERNVRLWVGLAAEIEVASYCERRGTGRIRARFTVSLLLQPRSEPASNMTLFSSIGYLDSVACQTSSRPSSFF